jgi:hypothetical protein
LAGSCGCVSVSAETVSGLKAILGSLSLGRGIPFPRICGPLLTAHGFADKVFQVCDRPRPLLAMYLATVDCATSMPSLSSLPSIRGAPHSRLARLISRIRRRISGVILGRPPWLRDF